MSLAHQHSYTVEEYLALEEKALEKSEYYRGEIFAMAGASPTHSLIATNVAGELRSRLRGGGCTSYGSDLRVATAPNGLYSYPDVSVICGRRETLDFSPTTVTNPTLLAEVASPATEAYDRGAKFALYRKIASLQEYVVIAQESPTVDVFRRGENGQWMLTPYAGLEAIARLESLGIELPLAEIFLGVEFPAVPAVRNAEAASRPETL